MTLGADHRPGEPTVSREEHSGSAEWHRRLDDAVTAREAWLDGRLVCSAAGKGPARPCCYGSHPRIVGYQGWGCRSLRPSGLRSAQGLVTEGDAVAYVNGVLKTKAAEADMLRAQAAVTQHERSMRDRSEPATDHTRRRLTL